MKKTFLVALERNLKMERFVTDDPVPMLRECLDRFDTRSSRFVLRVEQVPVKAVSA
jgi:hypothetical protein